MNKRTERTLLRITQETAKICGMEKAMKKKPDPQQEINKQKAKEILIRTRLPNDWSFEENITIAKQMQDVIDEPVRMIQDVDPKKRDAYDKVLSRRIANAIKTGELPDPRKDKDFMRMMQMRNKEL